MPNCSRYGHYSSPNEHYHLIKLTNSADFLESMLFVKGDKRIKAIKGYEPASDNGLSTEDVIDGHV